MTILMILLAAGCAGTPTSGSNTPLSLLTHLLVSQLLPSRTTVNYRRFRILTSAVFASPVQLWVSWWLRKDPPAPHFLFFYSLQKLLYTVLKDHFSNISISLIFDTKSPGVIILSAARRIPSRSGLRLMLHIYVWDSPPHMKHISFWVENFGRRPYCEPIETTSSYIFLRSFPYLSSRSIAMSRGRVISWYWLWYIKQMKIFRKGCFATPKAFWPCPWHVAICFWCFWKYFYHRWLRAQ